MALLHNIHIILWQFGFIIEMCLIFAILQLLYGTVYFWVSLGFLIFIYIFTVFSMWIICYCATYDEDGSDPFVPWFLPCYIIITNYEDPACLSVHQPILRHLSYFIALIPFAIYMIFIPVYIIIIAVKFIWKEDNLDREPFLWFTAIKLIYILPQNILHLVILCSYNNIDDMVLYSLLFTSIFIAFLWYISMFYLFLIIDMSWEWDDNLYFDVKYEWITNIVIWISGSSELLLILLYIVIYGVIGDINDDDDMFYILYLLCLIAGCLCMPLSIAICSKWYQNNTSMLRQTGRFYEKWVTSFDDKELLYDKIYIVAHMLSHKNQIESTVNDKLLNTNYIQTHIHKENSILCLKYQCDYFQLNMKEKQLLTNTLQYDSMWNRLFNTFCFKKKGWIIAVIFIFCLIIYIMARIYIMILFPFYWYFYIYLHVINGDTFCDQDKMDCIENIFMSAICFVYIIFVFIFIRLLIKIFIYEYWFGYFMNADIESYFLSNEIKRYHDFLSNGKRFTAVFQIVQHDIAMIICSFLIDDKTISDHLPDVLESHDLF